MYSSGSLVGKNNTNERAPNFSIYDVYGSTMTSPSVAPKYHRATAPVGVMSAAEFAAKFKAKPTTKPAVVGLDKTVSVPPASRGTPREFANQFPPSSRLKSSRDTRDGHNQMQSDKHFEIAPSPEMTARYYRENSGGSLNQQTQSPVDHNARRYPYYTNTYPNTVPEPRDHPQGGDLSYLPRPKNYLARRDIPWVYRYKVKKNMNQLSKIMTSGSGSNTKIYQQGAEILDAGV